MWAQGNQWNQMPLDAAAYQNMNHELVDWASLAQQWIRMKEVHETVVLNVQEMAQSHYQNTLNILQSPHTAAVELHQIDPSVVGGEAPMDVEKEDEIQSTIPGNWNWTPHGSNQHPQSWPQQGPCTPRHIFPQVSHPGTGLPPAHGPVQAFHSGIAPPVNFAPRVPLLPLPTRQLAPDEGNYNSLPILDAAKRKNLPAWIREGLEKMEKEKQKKEEREKFLMERELKRKQELESRFEGEVGVIRSRFDDSDEEDSNDESTTEGHTKHAVSNILSSTQTLEDMMVRIRQLMTEILLEVTTEEIRAAAVEASQRAKVKNRQAQSPPSSKSLTQKLGLDQYGSDSDSDENGMEDTQVGLRTNGVDSSAFEISRNKMNQKQVPIGENPSVRRLSDQGGKDSDQSEKLFLDESEGKQKKEDNFSSTMQDGTKVDTDITSKLPRGQDRSSALVTAQIEDSSRKSEEAYKLGDYKCVADLASKSREQSNLGDRTNQRSRSPERKKRSRSRDRHSSRRSKERRRSRSRRSRSRERKRSRSRRRSRSRDYGRSRSRRSRSSERKFVNRKGKERGSSRDKRK